MREEGVLFLSTRIRKMCCNRRLQGIGINVGGRGLAWPSLWLLGCVMDVKGGVADMWLPEYRDKKNPVNVGLQG